MKNIIGDINLLLSTSSFAQFKKGFGFTTGAWGSGFHFMVIAKVKRFTQDLR